MLDDDQIVSTHGEWKGLWDRSGDSPPPDHFSQFDDGMFSDDIVHSRTGFISSVTLTNIIRVVPFKLSSAPLTGRWLVLTNPSATNFELFDTGFSVVTPIYTFVEASNLADMQVAVIYDRAYISFHNRINGLTGRNLQVWDPNWGGGISVTRDAAGAAPTGTFTVAVSGTNGNVEPGLHIYAVAYETDTGHVTKPALYVSLTSPSGTKKKVDLTAIPLGPPSTRARWILASKVVNNFDGNLENPKLFFALRVGDNSTTSLTGVNALDFYDTQLQSDADYLKDIYTAIPSGVALSVYASRFCIGNIPDIVAGQGAPGGPIIVQRAERSMVLVSVQNQIETFSKVDGFQIIAKSEGGGIKHLSELNGVLYVRKSFMTFALQDNGFSPSKWPITTVDIAAGTECYGLASFPGTSSGSYKGIQVVADRSGLFAFDGVYPALPLSYKIDNIWKAFSPAFFDQIQISIDPEKNLIFVLAPPNEDAKLADFYVADCNEGLDPQTIRWMHWFVPARIRSAFVDYVGTITPQLTIAIAESAEVGVDPNQGILVQRPRSFLSSSPASQLYPGELQVVTAKFPIHATAGLGQVEKVAIKVNVLTESVDTLDLQIIVSDIPFALLSGLVSTFTGDPYDQLYIKMTRGNVISHDAIITLDDVTAGPKVFWAFSRIWLFGKEYADEVPA